MGYGGQFCSNCNNRRSMDQVKEQEKINQIQVRRPFIAKFIKELNHTQNDIYRKSRRKQKQQISLQGQKSDKGLKAGIQKSLKSLRKLGEVNRNGNRIIANWKNDQIHGQAQIYYHNGVVFKGQYQNGIKTFGHFKFNNGYQYRGHCIGNKFNGEGSFIFPSGKIVSGEWKDYTIVGNGKIEYPKGQVFYGQIQNFKKHGTGYLFFNDGSKYVGEFVAGKITGSGTYFIDDKPVQTGTWLNGELQISQGIQKIQVIELQKQLGKHVNDSGQKENHNLEAFEETKCSKNQANDRELSRNKSRKVRFAYSDI